MKKAQILLAFNRLNQLLADDDSIAEICLVGGAVMCLVFNARNQTKDVDALFHPKSKVYSLAKIIATEQRLPKDWLNDSAKLYVNPQLVKDEFLSLSNLKIYTPSAKYMLAMKCLASRVGTKDEDDIVFLIKYLKLRKPKDVFSIVISFYDEKYIQPKTKFLIEEIFSKI